MSTWPRREERTITRLTELAISLGEPFASAGNRPIHLDDSKVSWFVEQGALDVFLIEYQDGQPVSSAKHLLRAGAGRMVFGMGEGGPSMIAVAKGLPGSKLRRVMLDELVKHDVGDDLAHEVDAWVSDVSATVARQIELRPKLGLLLDPVNTEGTLEADAGTVLSTRPGHVLWASPGDNAAYLGTEEPEPGGTGLVPLTSETWLTLLKSPARVTGVSSRELGSRGALLQALDEFHRLALGAEQLNRRLSLADEANEQTAQAAHRRMDEEQARQSLFNVLSPAHRVVQEGGSSLMAALKLIGEHEGITFRLPSRHRVPVGEEPSLQDVLKASGVRSRKVRLSSEDRWWIGDSSAMLAYSHDDGRPLALLPGTAGRYRAVDPNSGRSERLNASRASEIARDAWVFYCPLPDDRPVRVMDILRLAGKNMAADIGRFLVAGLLASALMLAPAIAVGALADWVLPSASGGMLVQIIIALVAFAVVGLLLQMLQGTAMMRLEARATTRVGAAIWDRTLGLPSSFFKRFTAGDLAVRMSAFQVLRDQLSGVVANALLSIVFLLPTLSLLFFYDATLALTSLGIALLSLTVACAFGLLQIAPQRRRYAAVRHLAGELYQFISGMSKLRSAGAEASAFASWARGYREQHIAGMQIARLNEHLVAFSAAAPALVGAALFGVAVWQGPDQFAIGDFLVVYSVSLTFYTAIAGLGRSFEAIAAVVPGYEQVKPILDAVPDGRARGAAPAELSGDIHFDHLSFRYTDDGPPIINDISIDVRPGEFVAICGESGAGKSTLLRLALGLEDPSGGGVYYDGRDLTHLDRRSVRRQIGVVMQDGNLRPGNILDNIVGVDDGLTIDDAWRAARLADVDKDISAMPMEMFTIVGDNSSTFSGGQIQRIRIAAALVRDPRIVFLDEATSWLDAKSQAEVMQSIESLAATRIVIAHRLSTIRKAERIYVLQAGRVVQEGGFDELFNADGPFHDLVQRQMI